MPIKGVKIYYIFRDGRESNVVTKVFNVQYAEPNAVDSSESDVDNAVNFQNDLPKRSSVKFKIICYQLLVEFILLITVFNF